MSAMGFKARVDPVHAPWPECDGFLRFTSGVAPAEIMTASMAPGPWWDSNLVLRVLLHSGSRQAIK